MGRQRGKGRVGKRRVVQSRCKLKWREEKECITKVRKVFRKEKRGERQRRKHKEVKITLSRM